VPIASTRRLQIVLPTYLPTYLFRNKYCNVLRRSVYLCICSNKDSLSLYILTAYVRRCQVVHYILGRLHAGRCLNAVRVIGPHSLVDVVTLTGYIARRRLSVTHYAAGLGARCRPRQQLPVADTTAEAGQSMIRNRALGRSLAIARRLFPPLRPSRVMQTEYKRLFAPHR